MLNIKDFIGTKDYKRFERLASSAMLTYKANVRQQNKYVTGKSMMQFRIEFKVDLAKNALVYEFHYGNEAQLNQLETGRKEGQPVTYRGRLKWLHNQLPPIQPIKDWLQLKGYSHGEKDARKKAWGIAVNIARNGTKDYQQGQGRVVHLIYSHLVKRLTESVDKLSKQFQLEIVKNTINDLDKQIGKGK